MEFRLRDTGQLLSFDFDDEADVLYLWIGDEPEPGTTIPDGNGNLVRFRDDGAVIGFTVLDYRARWAEVDEIPIFAPTDHAPPVEPIQDEPRRIVLEACAR